MRGTEKRNRSIGLALALLVAVPSCAVAASQARAQSVGDIADIATYRIVTTVKDSGGNEFQRTTPALVGVPQAVNADRSALSLPDFTVVVTPLPGLISVKVVKVSTAPLPAKVELIFDLPGAAEQKLSVGYDTLASGARSPLSFGATATFSLGSPLVVDARTSIVGSGASLALIGSLFGRAADGTRANPKAARLEYTPVPENGRLRLQTADLADERTLDVHAETDRRVTAVISASDRGPAFEQRLDTTVVGMPTSLDVGLDLPDDKDDGRLDFNYAALERAQSIEAHGTKLEDGEIALDVRAKVTGMARTLDVVKLGKARLTLDADAAIDQADVAFAKGADASFPPESAVPPGMRHFALATDVDDPDGEVRNGFESAVARVRGLRHADFQLEDPIVVDVELAPGPFFVRAVRGPEPITATVRDMPAKARIELDKPVPDPVFGGVKVLTLDYTGTDADGKPATVGEIVADMTEPDGLPGALARGTEVNALVRGIPSGLSFRSHTIIGEGKLIELNAGGKTVGLAEITVSDGGELPEAERLADTHDGVVFRDIEERFHVFGRVTGLRSVSFEQEDLDAEAGEADVKQLLLDAVGDPDAEEPTKRRRPLHVDVRRAVAGSTEFVVVDLANLLPETTIRLARLVAGGVVVRHTAPTRIASAAADLTFRTSFGPIELVRGRLDPLPAGTTDMCFAKDAHCIGSEVDRCYTHDFEDVCVGTASTLSAGFRAFAPVDAELFVCEEKPADATCSINDDRATWVDLDLSSIEHLQFKFDSPKGEGDGHAFINTEDPNNAGQETMTGVIRRHEPNRILDGNVDLDLEATFSPVFRANDRFVRFNGPNANVKGPKFGFVECGDPGTTEIKVIVTGLAFDLGDRICKD